MRTITKAPMIERAGPFDLAEAAPALQDACTICEDRGQEWRLTRAGQFVRLRGEDPVRGEVVPAQEAQRQLDLLLEYDSILAIFPAWSREDEERAQILGWSLVMGDYRRVEVAADTRRTSVYDGPYGAERASDRIKEASRRPWYVSAQEATISRKALKAVEASARFSERMERP